MNENSTPRLWRVRFVTYFLMFLIMYPLLKFTKVLSIENELVSVLIISFIAYASLHAAEIIEARFAKHRKSS